MKTATAFHVVLVTAPTRALARKLAHAALDRRLIACANIVPHIESWYWWQARIQSGRELLLVMKTRRSRLAPLEKLVRQLHPYDTPEFIALPLTAASQPYLDWLRTETRYRTPRGRP